MKKRISIMVIMIAIMVLAGFTYYGSMEKTHWETNSIIIDKDGEVVEPSNTNNDHMGH